MKRVTSLLICVSMATFMGRLDVNIVAIALPTIANSFHVTSGAVSSIMISYMLVMAVLLIPLGSLGDRIGFWKLLILGYALFTIGSMSCGLSDSLSILVAARSLQGAGAATLLIAAYSLIPQRLPRNEIGAAMGILSLAGSVGILLGAPLGGILTEQVSWEAIFWVNIPIGLIAIWLAWRKVEPDNILIDKSKLPPFDWPGCFLGIGWVLLVILGIGQLRTDMLSLKAVGMIGTGGLLLAFFIRRERNCAHPMLDLSLFSNISFRRGLGTQAFIFIALASHGFTAPFYLSGVMDLSPQQIGLAIALFPVGTAIAAPLSGRLSDRISPIILSFIGAAGSAIVTGLFAISLHMGISWSIYAYLPCMGLTFGTFLSPTAKLLLTQMPPDRQGTATSIFHTTNNIAITMGIAIASLLINIRSTETAGINAESFFPLYLFNTVCCLVAALLALSSLASQRNHAHNETTPVN